MTDSKVTLGNFEFQGLEIPDRVILRNKQKLTVHRLTSGRRAIDASGTELQTIMFRGIFSGPGLAGRIKTLEEMRQQGQPLLLTWDFQVADVLIQDFELHYKSHRWVPYRLTLEALDFTVSARSIDPDIAWPTSSVRISEIVSLLNNTPFAMPPNVRTSLLQLGAGNYDATPSEALKSVVDFAASIDHALSLPRNIGISSITRQNETMNATPLQQMEEFRTEAHLRLSLNRIKEIAVQATEVAAES